jgi:hypothetical protein
MTDIDNELRDALRRGQEQAEAGRIPAFNVVWDRAESTIAERPEQRRRARVIGGIAAAIALVAVVFASQLHQAEQQWQFVDPSELATSTSWVAPSDVLLPKRQFDIFGEIPVLIESTDSDRGTLL